MAERLASGAEAFPQLLDRLEQAWAADQVEMTSESSARYEVARRAVEGALARLAELERINAINQEGAEYADELLKSQDSRIRHMRAVVEAAEVVATPYRYQNPDRLDRRERALIEALDVLKEYDNA